MASRSPSSSDGPGWTAQLVAALALWSHRHPKGIVAAASLLTGAVIVKRALTPPTELPLGLVAAGAVAMVFAALRFRRGLAALLIAPSLAGIAWTTGITEAPRLDLGLLVLVIGVDQGLHLLAGLRAPDDADLLTTFRRAGRTIIPVGASAAFGLSALGLVAGVPSLLVAAMGLGLTTLAQVTLLPALLGLVRPTWRLASAPGERWSQTLTRWAPTVGWATVLIVIALWPHTRDTPTAIGLSPSQLALATGVTLVALAFFRGMAAATTAGLTAAATVALTAGTMVATGTPLVPAHGVGLTMLFCLGLGAGNHLADRRDRSLAEVTRETSWAVASSTLAVVFGVLAASLVSPMGPLRAILLVGLAVQAAVATAAVPAMLAMVESARDSDDKGGLFTRLAVTVGLAGDAPVGPGTLGALVAVPLGFALQSWGLGLSIAIAVLLTALSIPITTRYLERTGRHDPSEVVLDELVGCLLAMVMVPFGLAWGWAAFGLFRLFDIAKPGPVRYVERRAGGAWGVIGDDVVAGIMAGAVLLGLRWAGHALGWWG